MLTQDEFANNSLYERLNELEKETDPEFVIELINIYMSETPKQIEKIANAIKEKDHIALKISAHTLKGSSLNLGAKQLGALCFKLEEIGKYNREITEEISISGIEQEFNKVVGALNSYKGNL